MTSEPPHEHATQLRNHWWWRPGWREGREFYTWHLTFEGQADLHRLVTEYQHALRDVPGLDLIPLEWLHLTMQGIGFTDEVTDEDLHAIMSAASQHVAELQPIDLTFERPSIRPEAITLQPKPMAQIVTIRDAIRIAIAAIWGEDQVPEGPRFTPHLSIAYVNSDGPSVAASSALAHVTPEPVMVTVQEAALIALRRNNQLYHWRMINGARLGHPPQS